MQNMFIELIRMAVGKAERLSHTPTPEEWQGLFDEAQRQTLEGVLFPALERLPAEQRPPKSVLLSWYSLKEMTISENQRLNKDCVWASRAFEKAGFRNVILKGQGNALLYPDPLLRRPGDIDIWLEGSRQKILDYAVSHFPNERVQWLEVNFPVKPDTVIEVHTAPSCMSNPFDDRRLQAYFRQHQAEMLNNRVALPDGEIAVPTPEVNLIFQLTHIYRHLFNEGIGLRQLMDYYYLLQNTATAERLAETSRMVSTLHMERFCRALMWVLGEVFLLETTRMVMPPDEEEGKFLLREIMLAGNFGHTDARNTLKTSKWGNFWQMTNRNWRFVTHYPREVWWNPIFRITQFVWRKRKGYK